MIPVVCPHDYDMPEHAGVYTRRDDGLDNARLRRQRKRGQLSHV